MTSNCVLYLFLIQFLLIRGETNFRDDYHYIQEFNSSYKIHTLPRTWDRAKTVCEREGATLFYVEDESEVIAVTDYWKGKQTLHWVFINMTVNDLKTEGKVITDYYTNWEKGEPNNAGGNEYCIVLSQKGTLNDVNCQVKYPFICKKTLSTVQWNTECNIPYQGYKFDNVLGRCYKFHSMSQNWTDAYSICYGEQSYLAVINDDKEASHLVNLFNSVEEQSSRTESVDAIHSGFFNRDGWNTIKGVPLHESGYNTWAQSQPDGGIGEDCGAMASDGLLHDVVCSRNMFFICEHEV